LVELLNLNWHNENYLFLILISQVGNFFDHP